MLAVGQILRGLIDPFILVPSLPEMIETVIPLYPESCESQINDISSGLFNMFLGLGQIIGPLFGAQVTEKYGFKTCCDSVAIICLSFSIFYYIFGNGNQAFRSSRWREVRNDGSEDRDCLVPLVRGTYTPCSNPMSVKFSSKDHGSQFSVNKSIRVRRKKFGGDGDLSIGDLSQGQLELKMKLIDQRSAYSGFNHNQAKLKEIKADDLHQKL